MKTTTHGGQRRGAGKKPGTRWPSTLAKEASYQVYREEVLARMEPIVRAQVEAAVGNFARVAVAEMTPKGLRLRRVTDEAELEGLLVAGACRVALADPDLPMSRYLTDQVVGKATDHLDLKVSGGLALNTRVVHEYRT